MIEKIGPVKVPNKMRMGQFIANSLWHEKRINETTEKTFNRLNHISDIELLKCLEEYKKYWEKIKEGCEK